VLAGVVAATAMKAVIVRFNTPEMSLTQRYRWLLLSRLSAHWLLWSGMPRQSFADWYLSLSIDMTLYKSIRAAWRAFWREWAIQKRINDLPDPLK
jgi:hypothetical protein